MPKKKFIEIINAKFVRSLCDFDDLSPNYSSNKFRNRAGRPRTHYSACFKNGKTKSQITVFITWRMGGDSNPRYLAVNTLSRRAHSTTLPPILLEIESRILVRALCGFKRSLAILFGELVSRQPVAAGAVF
jgi:hypothetical protein